MRTSAISISSLGCRPFGSMDLYGSSSVKETLTWSLSTAGSSLKTLIRGLGDYVGEDWGIVVIEYLKFICVCCKAPAFQRRSLIFFVQPFNTKAAGVATLRFLASLNSGWALAFLTMSLNAQATFLYYFFVTCPFFTIPWKAFLHRSSVLGSLFCQADLLIFLHVSWVLCWTVLVFVIRWH